jgi:ABC-type glycerol-3-phosphate transport system substrate-binding protein
MDMPSKPGKFLKVVAAVLVVLTLMPYPAPASGMTNLAAASLLSQGEPPRLEGGTSTIEVRADAFGLPLAEDAFARLYDKPSVFLQQGDSVHFNAVITKDGDYTISFDMAAPESFIKTPTGQLMIDGEYPLSDTQNIVFPIYYQNSTDAFPVDRYGNETLIRQDPLVRWSNAAIWDTSFSQEYPLQFHLTAGEHRFEFQLTQESMLLGSIYIEEFSEYPDYSTYLAGNQSPDSSGVLIELEAENPSYKNSTSIRPVSDRSLEVTPYDTYRLLLNTLGGETWDQSGSTVYYEFNVPQDGMYCITLRAIQNIKNNFTVFRKILVNDTVLYTELNAVPFEYSTDWANITLGGDTPYKIFLHKGKNVLGIEATTSPYNSAIQTIKQALFDINDLSLEIKKLTGNQVDRYREWKISDYIPDIKERLIAIADNLSADLDELSALSKSGGSQEVMTYQMAIDNILFLTQDPDKIPYYMNRFSEGTGSAARLLGNLLPSLQSQPLALDKIYIHSPDVVPPAVKVPFFTSFTEGAKRFFHSFLPDPYQTIGAEEDELEVWVARSRQYVDLLQSMTDESFTKDTGIKIKFSIMPDEGKLVLANAANITPDIALGVSTHIPYDLAIRNALYDLRSFDDFDSYISIFSPGAMLSYIINDSVYAIPETQDFWVTFYRKDIMDSLGLPVPITWDEVIEILPVLQRYGLNYNSPLSTSSGSKGLNETAPYIFNYGAQLFSEDGFSTGLGSDRAIEGIKFMADSFTIYGMPLTTSSFYESFRDGSLPIGISNLTDYIKLLTAAPEIEGLWGIDLYPATVQPDGTQLRYATGSAQACIIFADAKRPEDAWTFMKWWMSTETQVDFQQQLILNYGIEYLWSSANVEAFTYSPIPQEHIDVILKQWEWLQEPVMLPGSYMLERELKNAWNAIVFDGKNPRVAIDDSITIINREITRKMEEFGYLRNGQIVKQYKIPTTETVKEWVANAK